MVREVSICAESTESMVDNMEPEISHILRNKSLISEYALDMI